MSALNPFLDNIETVGIKKRVAPVENEQQKRVLYNRRRGNRISSLARKNRQLYNDVDGYLMKTKMADDELMFFVNFRASLGNCCSHSLYRHHNSNNALEYVASHTCKHKLCHVCNAERSKMLRRKYISYFSKNATLLKEFDFQHLTLTVPHTGKGWKGQRIYIRELIKQFNWLRKKSFWKEMVYSGEFGIEVTKNENGLHIHIHAMLLIWKGQQNRNTLHKEILYHWNKQTVDPEAKREQFSQEEIEAIKKGNKLIDERFVRSLDPKGATFIGLESLYTIKNGKKNYVKVEKFEDFIGGLMECIKYHFEPLCMNKSDGSYDYELMREIMPAVRGIPLYRKFGAFHGVKELNVNDKSFQEEITEVLEDLGNENVINPETHEIAYREEYQYLVASASSVFYIQNDNYRPVLRQRSKRKYLHHADTMLDAMLDMMKMSIGHQVTNKGKPEIYKESSNKCLTKTPN